MCIRDRRHPAPQHRPHRRPVGEVGVRPDPCEPKPPGRDRRERVVKDRIQRARENAPPASVREHEHPERRVARTSRVLDIEQVDPAHNVAAVPVTIAAVPVTAVPGDDRPGHTGTARLPFATLEQPGAVRRARGHHARQEPRGDLIQFRRHARAVLLAPGTQKKLSLIHI